MNADVATWIRSHSDLLDHPKTIATAAALGLPQQQVIGMLHGLWWWAIDRCPSGLVTPEGVAAAMRWPDDVSSLVDALLVAPPGHDAGFLERNGGGALRIHDWDDYSGGLIARRRADAERKRTARRPQDVRRTAAGIPYPEGEGEREKSISNRAVENAENRGRKRGPGRNP